MMSPLVGVIDYGMGNLLSVRNALERLGAEVKLCKTPADLKSVERIILPGVGAFTQCMNNLRTKNWITPLNQEVFQERKPILGICLGMHAMLQKGFEGGETEGLGWLEGDVVKINSQESHLRVPHIGWQEINWRADSLFKGLPKNPDFYFVHSYHVRCRHSEDIAATCEYGFPLTAAIVKGNIAATQFHPEKSQEHGLRVLENFLNWKPT